jgi:hypothetical protein
MNSSDPRTGGSISNFQGTGWLAQSIVFCIWHGLDSAFTLIAATPIPIIQVVFSIMHSYVGITVLALAVSSALSAPIR